MTSYAEIKKNRGSSEERMKAQIDKLAEKNSGVNTQLENETFLDISHVRGKDGTGSMVLRWLPAPENEDNDFVSYFEYFFEGPGGWYVQKGRNSLGKDFKDPVKEYNDSIFRNRTLTDDERKKKLLGRKQNYVSNVLVIKDANKPENEGKVFRFKYGPQIFKILEAAQFPKPVVGLEDETPRKVSVWDPFEGANFHLIVTSKQVGSKQVPSYEDSKFASKDSSIVKQPEDFDVIWKSQYSLEHLMKESAFKTYDELVCEFNRAMGYNEGAMSSEKSQPIAEYEQSTRVDNEGVMSSEKSQPIDWSDTAWGNKSGSSSPATAADGGDDDWFNQLKGG